jgi:hypothetical protein
MGGALPLHRLPLYGRKRSQLKGGGTSSCPPPSPSLPLSLSPSPSPSFPPPLSAAAVGLLQ